MASESEIAAVVNLIGADATSHENFTEEAIGVALDAGDTPDEIAYRWWSKRAADTANFVDISESGSSRTMSTIHRNATALAANFKKLIDSAEEEEEEVTPRSRIRSIPMRRI